MHFRIGLVTRYIDFTNNKLTFRSSYCICHCISLTNNVPEFPEASSAFGYDRHNNSQNNSEPVSLPVSIIDNNSSKHFSKSLRKTSKTNINKSLKKSLKNSSINSKFIEINIPDSAFPIFTSIPQFSNTKSTTEPSTINDPSYKCSCTTVSNSDSKFISLSLESINDISNSSNRIITLPKELISYKDVFSESAANELPPHRPYDCEIRLKENSKLFYGPIYPLTDEESKALEKYIKENLKKGFIRKSKSPAGAPVLFVVKKNGELRMVVDFRQLNLITIRDSYPLPLINDMLEHLAKGKIFSKLDLRSAYNLVRIKKGDEYKTAFTCKFGHFEYLVMPFGLKNAPAVFQHFINDVLEDVLGKFAYSYIDDIIIFSPNFKTHISHVKTVLELLRSAGLYAKLEKCEFFVPFIDFLGHRISSEGIHMDPSKVSSILNWPTPSNIKDVQSFIGLANYYRRFIPGFATIARPLHKLLKKNIKFIWSSEAQTAFDTLKSKFISAPVLAFPDRDIPFQVETDSSNFAIGAILSQVSPQDNMVHPVAFFSRSLTGPERNYPIYDKELLAIVAALENWRHLLKGTSTPFKIFSDHRNLLYQKKPEKMSQRLVRWALFLSEFNFVIVYRSGSSNGKPDALSRRPDYSSNADLSSNPSFLLFLLLVMKSLLPIILTIFTPKFAIILINLFLLLRILKLKNSLLVIASFFSTIKSMSLLSAALLFLKFVMILHLLGTLVSKKLLLLSLAISGGLLFLLMFLTIFALVKLVLVLNHLVTNLTDFCNPSKLLIVRGRLFPWISLLTFLPPITLPVFSSLLID